MGMYVPDIQGVTADTDTDLLIKAQTACSLLQDYDFVFVHINGADESAHRSDYTEKVRFVEKIDREFIAYLLDDTDKDTRIMICADHGTDPENGKHVHLLVPYIIRNAVDKNRELSEQITSPIEALLYLLAK